MKAAACVDEDERYERVRAARSLRSWTDPDGAGRIDIRGPVDATARVLAAIAPFERELFETARVDGRHERSDALAFDALVALADALRRGRRRTAARCGRCAMPRRHEAVAGSEVVVRIDHAALLRGRTEPGEVCEIVGSGPIPVAWRTPPRRRVREGCCSSTAPTCSRCRTWAAPFRRGCAPRSRSCTGMRHRGVSRRQQPRDRPQPADRGGRQDRACQSRAALRSSPPAQAPPPAPPRRRTRPHAVRSCTRSRSDDAERRRARASAANRAHGREPGVAQMLRS